MTPESLSHTPLLSLPGPPHMASGISTQRLFSSYYQEAISPHSCENYCNILSQWIHSLNLDVPQYVPVLKHVYGKCIHMLLTTLKINV